MRLIPRRARLALLDWARRYSGYDEHMAQEHPLAGLLLWGDVRAGIKTLTLREGMLLVRATAGTGQYGAVSGIPMLADLDGKPVLRGTRPADMGVKLSWSTWTFEYALNLTDMRMETGAPRAPETSS